VLRLCRDPAQSRGSGRRQRPRCFDAPTATLPGCREDPGYLQLIPRGPARGASARTLRHQEHLKWDTRPYLDVNNTGSDTSRFMAMQGMTQENTFRTERSLSKNYKLINMSLCLNKQHAMSFLIKHYTTKTYGVWKYSSTHS